jgi:transcription-repair coupling factor (superfamily II helicase)
MTGVRELSIIATPPVDEEALDLVEMLDARHDVERLAAAVALAQERLADGES